MTNVANKSEEFTLAGFMNGTVKPDCVRNLQLSMYKKETTSSKDKGSKLLVAETNSMIYSSERTQHLQPNEDLMKYMVGVFDPETNEMKVHPASSFMLRPYFPDSQSNNEQKEMTRSEKNDQLTEAFGSRKGKRAMHMRRQNIIDKEGLETKITKQADVMDVPTPNQANVATPSQGVKPDDGQYSLLPPFNKEALEPGDVYDIDAIVPPNELEALQTPANELIDATREDIQKWEKEDRFGKEVIKILKMLPVKEDLRIRKCCCALMLHYMITIYHFNFRVWRLKNPFASLEDDNCVPGPVKKGLLSRFTSKPENSGTHMVPSRLKDKLVLYTMVLTLYLEEYTFMYEDLRFDLGIPMEKTKNFLRILGCKLPAAKRSVDGESRPVAMLVTPLQLPEIKPVRRKTGRRT